MQQSLRVQYERCQRVRTFVADASFSAVVGHSLFTSQLAAFQLCASYNANNVATSEIL